MQLVSFFTELPVREARFIVDSDAVASFLTVEVLVKSTVLTGPSRVRLHSQFASMWGELFCGAAPPCLELHGPLVLLVVVVLVVLVLTVVLVLEVVLLVWWSYSGRPDHWPSCSSWSWWSSWHLRRVQGFCFAVWKSALTQYSYL